MDTLFFYSNLVKLQETDKPILATIDTMLTDYPIFLIIHSLTRDKVHINLPRVNRHEFEKGGDQTTIASVAIEIHDH